MKLADVCPLFKPKDKSETNNYRPISLLLTLSKLLEKIICDKVYTFLNNTNQVYVSQYGFRSSHSCENAISKLVSAVLKGFQSNKYTVGVFLDLSKTHNNLRFLKWSLEQEFVTLLDWFRANKLTLNLDKTAYILFQKSGPTKEIDLELDGMTVHSVGTTKFLGMWLDKHLNWSTHLNKLYTKLK